MPQALQTGVRTCIRHPVPEDAEEFLALNRLSKRHYAAWVAPPTQPAEYAAYLERCQRADFEGLLVCRRSDAAILGAVNLSQIVYGAFQNCYMGYQIGAPYAGQGYMSEALRLVLRHAFTTLKLHRIEANIQPANLASIALVRRVGFRREGYSPRYLKIAGRWRDHERWAILREDWQRARHQQLRPAPPPAQD